MNTPCNAASKTSPISSLSGIETALCTSPAIEALTPTSSDWEACETVQDRYNLMKRLIHEAFGGLPVHNKPPKNPTLPSSLSGIEVAARFVEDRLKAYVEENGSCDYSTGVMEYPGDGSQYVYELEEIIEGIRAIATEVPANG